MILIKTKFFDYVKTIICVFIGLLFFATNNVYAESDTSNDIIDIEDYEIPQEFLEKYSLENYSWYKVQAKYWLVYHTKHSIDFGDIFMSTSQLACDRLGYNQNHTYAFTRFEKEDGTLIDNINFLEYRYTNEKGFSDNFWQTVNVLENGNTKYDYNGTFLSMNNILKFDNGNGAIQNGAIIPGLTLLNYTPFAQARPVCKVAYSQDDLNNLDFDAYFDDGEIKEVLEYEDCNYLLYFPTQCIKELAYINVWWVEEKLNDDGTIEKVDNRGTLTQDGSALGVDKNNEAGIYNINKELLSEYMIREDGIIVDPNGNALIDWSSQCKGATTTALIKGDEAVNGDNCKCGDLPGWFPQWMMDLYHDINCDTSWLTQLLGSIKLIGIISGIGIVIIAMIWLLDKLANIIRAFKR